MRDQIKSMLKHYGKKKLTKKYKHKRMRKDFRHRYKINKRKWGK